MKTNSAKIYSNKNYLPLLQCFLPFESKIAPMTFEFVAPISSLQAKQEFDKYC